MKRVMTLSFWAGAIVLCLGISLPAEVSEYSEWLGVTNLGPVFNSPGPYPAGEDSTPFVSRDGLSLYFISNRPGGYGDTDLYVSTRESRTADWGLPQNLGPVVNSPDRVRSPRLSPDGHRLYFAIVRNGNFDIYVSHRRDKKDDVGWEPPVPVAELNTPYHDVGLAFFEEEASGDLVAYFGSARPTSPDDLVYDSNLYVTRLQDDGIFSTPALVPELNTDQSFEWGATVRRDGLEMFFDRTPSADATGWIMTSTRESQSDPWSAPVAVPSPVNGDRNRHGAVALIRRDGAVLRLVQAQSPRPLGAFPGCERRHPRQAEGPLTAWPCGTPFDSVACSDTAAPG